MINKIFNEDCLDGMKRIPDKSVDMILCDLPYGTTRNKWDSIISLEPLWEQYERVIKDNGAIVLTAVQPFTTKVINSNELLFRQSLVWEKERPSNPFEANRKFMRWHEDVLVFYKKQPTYNAQKEKRPEKNKRNNKEMGRHHSKSYQGSFTTGKGDSDLKHPSSVIKCNVVNGKERQGHPTQKPVALFEYLIKTYTNEWETVLDNCMGSGTTAIAAINTNRNYIGFELDSTYHELATKRVENHISSTKEEVNNG